MPGVIGNRRGPVGNGGSVHGGLKVGHGASGFIHVAHMDLYVSQAEVVQVVQDHFCYVGELMGGEIVRDADVRFVPDWMVLNPQNNNNRIIPPSMYPEFAELIVAFILYAKQHYGANINIIVFDRRTRQVQPATCRSH